MDTHTARVKGTWTAGVLLGLVLLPASAGAQSGLGPSPYDEPGMDVIELHDLQPRRAPSPQRLPDPTALPNPAVALEATVSEVCLHGVVCAKKPGTDALLEARAGYTFGEWSPAAVEATFGLGNFGLGIPRNILFIGEVGLTTDARAVDEADVRFSTVDFSGGVRAYWPMRGSFALYADVLFGGASHWLAMEGAQDHLWNIMGQLAVGLEVHIAGPLSLVCRAKASFFGLGGALVVAAAANGEPQVAMAVAQSTTRETREAGALRLALTAGPSLSF